MPKEKTQIGQDTEILRVKVQRVRKYDPENGFSILIGHDSKGKQHSILGHYHENALDHDIVAHGVFHDTEKYGQQFRAAYIEPGDLVSPDRVATYLASLGIPGIGLKISKHIARHFGSSTFEIIDTDPTRLLEARKVQQKSVDYIEQNWQGLDKNRELIMFLLDIGIQPKVVPEVKNRLGYSAADKIVQDPYILCRRISGIGFVKADAIARRFGIDIHSPVRKRAILDNILQKANKDGMCGVPVDHMLSESSRDLKLPIDNMSDFLDQMIEENKLEIHKIKGQDILYSPYVIATERGIARKLMAMTEKSPEWLRRGLDIETSLHKFGKTLGTDQASAVRTILTEHVSVMTGGPGVGKTTTLRTVLDILEDSGVDMKLCAPTGMAAKRMLEATGREATTIHSMLEVDGYDNSFKRHENNPIDADFVVVDEASMTDIRLTSSLLSAIGPQTSLLIVGDVDQLPSVGPGRVLHDIIESGKVPVSNLKQIYRQGKDSLIIKAAHAINRGEMPPPAPTGVSGSTLDFLFLRKETSQLAQDTILELVCNRLKNHPIFKDGYDPIRDVMVVAAMRKGDAGVNSLNVKLRAALNPLPDEGSKNRIDIQDLGDGGTVSFGLGDKIMNTQNKAQKGIVNGDIGYIRKINKAQDKLIVEFDVGMIELTRADLPDLQLAYANTVHKCQGSESKVLIMPVVNEFSIMLQRNLIYTGLTRAKTLGIIVGQERALKKAVSTIDNQERWTFTGEALRRSVQEHRLDLPEDCNLGF